MSFLKDSDEDKKDVTSSTVEHAESNEKKTVNIEPQLLLLNT